MTKNSNHLAAVLLLTAIAAGVIYFAAHMKDWAPSAKPALQTQGHRGPADIYPNPEITPGAINSDITQENIYQTICNPEWSTKSERPPTSYTNRLKREGFEQYNDTDRNPADYEEDHLIPLEIGGNPTDPKNLWPEPYSTSIPDGGARHKDKVENYLHTQVCSGGMTLAAAQHAIVEDWYEIYLTQIGR